LDAGGLIIKGSTRGHIPKSILVGIEEGIFDALPQRVLDNLRHPASENALVWNLIYPLARPGIPIQAVFALRPLWGTPSLRPEEDSLQPFFWGYSISGQRLSDLDSTLRSINGPGPQTEVDLFLVGRRNLVLVEAKNRSGLGRCSRYQKGHCPEVLGEGGSTQSCRYWHAPEARFSDFVDLEPRPTSEGPPPACSTHYQLARTLLVGRELAMRTQKRLHFWMILPRKRWRALQRTWVDFCDRLHDDALWRRMRVLAWEDVRDLL
jgi:hypothetical protein